MAAGIIPNLSQDVWIEELNDSVELKQVLRQSVQSSSTPALVLGMSGRSQKWWIQKWICPLSAVWAGEPRLHCHPL